jgi:hypothetical protein
MMIASKVWDDTSMWNCDFCMIHPFFPLQLLNKWERNFLSAIGYDIFVSAKMYKTFALLFNSKTILFLGMQNIISTLEQKRSSSMED